MRILLTNDDGITAPGLTALRRRLGDFGEVDVAAPESAQSATAHGITINAGLEVTGVHVHQEFHGWAIAGRPADCVKLAVQELVAQPPDLVVSGINDGANVGINVLYSGTVAAAAEGALLGFPAVAVSLQRSPEMDYARAAEIAGRLITHLVQRGVSAGQLFNVNIPDLSPGRPRGVRVARQSVQAIRDCYQRAEHPGGVHYWLVDPGPLDDTLKGEDVAALRDGFVVVTPLHFDLTDRQRQADLETWEWPAVG